MFTSPMGEITKLVLLFSNLNCRVFPKPTRNFTSKDDILVSSTDCSSLQFIILESSKISKNSNLSIKIGEDNKIQLESNSEYALMARLYTLTGFCDTIPITFKTVEDLTYNASIYIGVGSAIFLIFILTVISILIYYCLKRIDKKKSE